MLFFPPPMFGKGGGTGLAAGAYRYFKWNVTSGSNGSYINIREWQLASVVSGSSLIQSKTVVSQSPNSGGGFIAQNAINGNTGIGDVWEAGPGYPHYMVVDVGAGNEFVPHEMRIWPHSLAFPYAWTLSGSNDNSTFTTIDTRSGQTSWTTGTSNNYTF
jgi:hypothetical protein